MNNKPIPRIFFTFYLISVLLPFVSKNGMAVSVYGQETGLKKEHAAIIDRIIGRAGEFQSLLLEPNILSYRSLFLSPDEKANMTIHFWHRDDFQTVQKITNRENHLKHYAILVGEETTGGGNRTLITLQFHENTGRKLAIYDEIAQSYNIAAEFFEDGTPKMCRAALYNESVGWFDEKTAAVIMWDTDKKIQSQKNIGTLQQLPNLEQKRILLDYKHPVSAKTVQDMPDGKEVAGILHRIKVMSSVHKIYDLMPCLTFELFDGQHPSGIIRITDKRIQSILFICQKEYDGDDDRILGYYIAWDNDNNIGVYAEGNLLKTLSDYYDSEKRDKKEFGLHRAIDEKGRGIEVRFHTNGMPKSYRTIVRSRLFGRQIEWDKNGNVISDIDLDIPKEIKEKK